MTLLNWLPVRIRLDPDDPRPQELADCLAALAARLDERPQPMRVAITAAAPGGLPVVLDLLGDGSAFSISAGAHRPVKLNLRRRWIPEHPVPLTLRPGRTTVLYATPTDANRFRVSTRVTLAWLTASWRRRT